MIAMMTITTMLFPEMLVLLSSAAMLRMVIT
jgi:hypothetical protein